MSPEAISLVAGLRPGMTVYIEGSVGEPRSLIEALIARPEAAEGVHFVSPFVPGINRTNLASLTTSTTLTVFMSGPPLTEGESAGRVRYMPMTWSAISGYLKRMRFDEAWVQACPPIGDECSLGLGAGFIAEVVSNAQRLIVETNAALPRTQGHATLRLRDDAVVVQSELPPFEFSAPAPDDVSRRIADHIAGLVRDGDTLQLGVGRIPSAALGRLHGHQHLGLHSGVAGNEVLDLIEAGVMDGSRKYLDRGIAIAAGIAGTTRFHDALRHGVPVHVAASSYTHDSAVLAAQNGLVSINGALEADLRGHVNVEWANGRRVSAPGGFTDFLRGAQRAQRGRAIVALPSTTSDGRSRIVPRLTTPSVTSSVDVFTLVTEYGAAVLEGLDEATRARAVIAVAAPQHRETLERAWHAAASLR